MKRFFDCPACQTAGNADEAYVGRQVRCRQCDHRFVIPGDDEPESDGYSLEKPTPRPGPKSEPAGVFVASPDEKPPVVLSRRKPRSRSPGLKQRSSRSERPVFSSGSWLIRVGAFTFVTIGAIALFSPRGLVISGSVLVILGMVSILVGYAAEAYGAFSEDFPYGFFY